MRLRRVLAVVLVALSLALAGCTRERARPEGIAERWLQAVSDRGRDGLREDAEERMREFGTAEPIPVPDAEPDERTFRDLEVGKARGAIDSAFVPFRVTARLEGDRRREITGVLELLVDGDSWKVNRVMPAGPNDKVPSQGGPRPAGANLSHWLLAVVLSGVLTGAAALVIERQR